MENSRDKSWLSNLEIYFAFIIVSQPLPILCPGSSTTYLHIFRRNATACA
jgi:hypothetical protein